LGTECEKWGRRVCVTFPSQFVVVGEKVLMWIVLQASNVSVSSVLLCVVEYICSRGAFTARREGRYD
jgi:hypothetical protein